MSILIVLAHPNQGSFNHAIAETLRDSLQAAGKTVVLRDLQAAGFDPVYTAAEMPRDALPPPAIQAAIDDVMAAEGIIFVHPNYWSAPPAILKGWLDRVLRPGVCYRFQTGPDGKGYVESLIGVTAAMVVTTANTPDEVDRDVYGDPLQNFWQKCVFGFLGIRRFKRLSFSSVIVSTPDQRARWLEEARREALAMFA